MLVKIFKYGLVISGETVLELPIGSKILKIDNQYNSIQMWVQTIEGVDKYETRKFFSIKTGSLFENDNLQYLNTVILDDGDYVAHIFEVIN